MKKKAQYILVADYVPLANKGEEAIVRGIEDMFSDGRPIKLGLFDNVEQVTCKDSITVFPKEWIFEFEGNTGLSKWHCLFLQVLISLKMRFGFYSKLRNLISSSNKKYQQLQDFFNRTEYVLVGHNGVFCVESCGIVHIARQAGKCAGILGSSGGIGPIGRVYKGWLYRRAMEESNFCFFRERNTIESMRQISRSPDKLILAPDPAFAMRPAQTDAASKVLECYEKYRCAHNSNRPIIATTVLETGVVYAGFKPELKGQTKRQEHARYIGAILNSLIKERNAFLIFLPHSIEKDKSDITAAKHVSEAMNFDPDDYMILEQDIPARLLKAIIKKCDFLVGERTHSLIGSIAVGTPFLALTNHRDRRTHGILGDMCHCENHIVDMNTTDEQAAQQKALMLFDNRATTKKELKQLGRELSDRLKDAMKTIKADKASAQGAGHE